VDGDDIQRIESEEDADTGIRVDAGEGCVQISLWDEEGDTSVILSNRAFLQWIEDMNKFAKELRS